MKPRRVIITLEIETDAPPKVLQSKDGWQLAAERLGRWTFMGVRQVSVNVIREGREGKEKG